MTEPTTPLPESPYCRVRARVASIWADGPDAGTSPDWRPAVGEKVTLTPSIGAQLLVYDVAGPEPIIVTVERVQCEVDADGWLVKADGRPVYIAPTDDPLLSAVGWTWTATIKGKSIPFPAPAGGVVNLALYIDNLAVDATEYVSVVQIVADYIAANPPDVEQAVEDYLTANPPAAGLDTEAAQDVVGAMIVSAGGTYDDNAGTITLPSVGGAGDVSLVLWDEGQAAYPARPASPMAIWRGPADPRLIVGSGFVAGVDLWAANAMDAEAPSAVSNLTADPSATSVTLSWGAATDDTGVTGYEVRIGAGEWSDNGPGLSATLTGLDEGTAYTFGVRAYDAAGHRGPAATVSTTTTGTSDTAAPTWAATLTTGSPTQTSVDIAASALAADNVAVTGYEVSIDNGATWAAITPSGSTFTISGLSAETGYPAPQFRAKDAAGNLSAVLSAQAFTTAAPVDDTTPPAPGALSATAIGNTGFTLEVTGASDAGSGLNATPYSFSTDNGATWSAWQASAEYSATGLTAETSYQCQHKVRDAATVPNEATGTAITVTTTATGSSSSPDNIAGLAMWLAADEITGLSDGDPVQVWEDLTSNNNDAVGGTARGAYRSAGVGAMPSVEFPANTLGTANIPRNLLRNLGGATLFFVMQLDASTASAPTIFASTRPTTTAGNILQVYRNSTTLSVGARRLDGDTIQITSSEPGALPTGAPVLVSIVVDWQNTDLYGYVDGAQALFTNSLLTAGNSADADAAGAAIGNTASPASSSAMAGDIGEVLVYQSALSTAERQDVESYLMSKWGIA